MIQFYFNTLKYLGLSIYSYDRCVANKMINIKQCIIVWYIDDNKLLYVDPIVASDIIEEIKKHFGYLVIRRDYTHDLLGMNIEIMKENKVHLIITHQIKNPASQFKDICF